MKISPCFLFFAVFFCPIAVGQDLPLPPQDAERPPLSEMMKDEDFVRFYEQMTGQKLSDVAVSPNQMTREPVDWDISLQDNMEPIKKLPRLQNVIAVQQLSRLDQIKSEVLNDLCHAETCGYHGIGGMSADGDVQTDFQSRRYVTTDRPFDWAIHGDGFFILRLKERPATEDLSAAKPAPYFYYTRAGRFELTDDRKLCLKHNGETYLLQPEIEILEQSGTFDIRDGRLIVTQADGSITELSELQLTYFDQPEQLNRIDGILFFAERHGKWPVSLKLCDTSSTTVRSREYEASNVDFAKTLAVYRALHRLQTAILETLLED